MGSSYSKICIHCKRRINLRKMPNGKWVAFEGYDTVHDCKKPIARNPSSSKRYSRHEEDQTIYDRVDIPEVEIDKPDGGTQLGTQPRPHSSGQSSPPILPPVGYEQPSPSPFSKVPPIVWWIAVGFLLLWLARST